MIAVLFLLLVAAVLGWAVETRVRALFARPGQPTAAFRPLPPGTVWRPCHDTACGHMATRHLPQPDDTYRCEQWAQHRGSVHLSTAKEGRDA